MARKSNIQRELKRERLVNKYSEKRKQIKKMINTQTSLEILQKLLENLDMFHKDQRQYQ